MACVVYGRFGSKIRFENDSDGRFDSRFDSNENKRFAGPYVTVFTFNDLVWFQSVSCEKLHVQYWFQYFWKNDSF